MRHAGVGAAAAGWAMFIVRTWVAATCRRAAVSRAAMSPIA
jgi:hypothetical protein